MLRKATEDKLMENSKRCVFTISKPQEAARAAQSYKPSYDADYGMGNITLLFYTR